MVVLVGLWVSVGLLSAPLEFGQFVGAVAQLLLRPPLVGLGDGGSAAAVREPGLRLRPPLSGSVRIRLLVLIEGQVGPPQVHALPPVHRARGEDGGNDGSQALPGPRGEHRLGARVADPSDHLVPELVGPGFDFSLGLKDQTKIRELMKQFEQKKLPDYSF